MAAKSRKQVDGLFDQVIASVQHKLMEKASPVTDRIQDQWLNAQKGFINTINKTLNIDLKTSYTEELANKQKAAYERKVEKQMQKEVGLQLDRNRQLHKLRTRHYNELMERYKGDRAAEKLIREAKEKELNKIDQQYVSMTNPYQQKLKNYIKNDKFIQRDEEDYDHLNHDVTANPATQSNDLSQLQAILAAGVSSALATTPIQIEKTQQDREDEYREQQEKLYQDREAQELEDEFRDESLSLQEEQLKYLKRISDKEFGGGGEGEGGGGLLGTVMDMVGLGSGGGGGKGKGGLARIAGSVMGKGGALLKGAGALVSKAALPLAIATAGYGAIKGAFDTDSIAAREGKNKEDITAGDRIKSGGAQMLSTLTGGLIEKDSILNFGESVGNFLTGNGYKTNNELKREGVDPGKGIFDRLMDAHPAKLMTDLITGNSEGNSILQWGKDMLGLTTEEDLAKREEEKQKRLSQIGTDGEDAELDLERQRLNELEDKILQQASGEYDIVDEEHELTQQELDQNIERSALVAQADSEGFYGKPNHLQELDQMYGLDSSSPQQELELADAEDSPAGVTGQTNVITNNNSTIVQQEAPRFRISDQSTMMLSTQGA